MGAGRCMVHLLEQGDVWFCERTETGVVQALAAQVLLLADVGNCDGGVDARLDGRHGVQEDPVDDFIMLVLEVSMDPAATVTSDTCKGWRYVIE